MTREIGIQFSAPMVRAILDGSKTVTRRTVKGEIPSGATRAVFNQWTGSRAAAWHWIDSAGARVGKPFHCPYGLPGDRLWVREAWRASLAFELTKPSEITVGSPVAYVAGGGALPAFNAGKFRPGMFMPRWASRIVLEVTDVQVQRLKDMADADALAEGVERSTSTVAPVALATLQNGSIHVDRFARLWDSLNGEGAWNQNPFVFCVHFKRITP